MLPGPVFFHELRTVARRKRAYALRALIGLFLVYIVSMVTSRWDPYSSSTTRPEGVSPHELAMLGGELFGAVVWLQGAVIFFLTPALLAGTIAEDRQRRVLAYLLASPLTGAEIILGKLAARLISLVVLVAVGLPVVSLCLLFGGIQPAEVWLAYGASFSALYFLAGLSIFVSTFSARPRDAIVRTYFFAWVWFFLPLLEWIASSVGGSAASLVQAARPVTEWITDSSPGALLFRSWSFTGTGTLSALFWMIGLQVLYGTTLLAWATIRLRPLERGSRLWGFGWLGAKTASPARRLFKRRACGNAPMIWKECTGVFTSTSTLRTLTLLLFGLGAVGGLGFWVYAMGIPAFQEVLDYGYGSTIPSTDRDYLNMGVRTLTAIVYILMALLLGSSAATGITMEHEKDTWVSLASTPLEGSEILKGKVLGALWRVRGLLGALVLVWLIGMVCGAVHPLGFLLAIVATTIYALFIALLGTYFSLRFRSSARSIAVTMAVLVFLNGGYIFCCIPIVQGSDSEVILAGVTPMVVTGAAFSFGDIDRLFQNSYPPHDWGAQIIMLGFFSFVFYGTAAFALLHACLNRFEIEVDRPRRFFRGYGSHVSREGIRFEDEEGTSQEGISFIEAADVGDDLPETAGTDEDSSARPAH
jgi:ABC-type transport system involved in multi-copper enzyme maturation permease subunit